MEIAGYCLLGVGFIIALIYGIKFLIAAFRTSVLWGLGCLFLSFPVSIIFLIMHWNVAKKPFFGQLVGLVVMAIGGALAGPAILEKINEAVEQQNRASLSAPANP